MDQQTTARVNRAHSVFSHLAAMALCALLWAAPIEVARAAPPALGLDKSLCVEEPVAGPGLIEPCFKQDAPPYAGVWYKIVITNLGAAQNFTLTDDLPSKSGENEFKPIEAWCADASGANKTTVAVGDPFIASMSIAPSGAKIVCAIYGHFSHTDQAGALQSQAINVASADNAKSKSNQVTTTVPLNKFVDLEIKKELASANVIDVSDGKGPQPVEFKITVKNIGTTGAFLTDIFELRDELALLPGGAPLKVDFASVTCVASSTATDCIDAANPTKFTPPLNTSHSTFLAWKFPAGSLGHLPFGGSFELRYTLIVDRDPNFDCLDVENADGLSNRAAYSLVYAGSFYPAKTVLSDVQTVKVTTGNKKNPCPPVPPPWSPIEVEKQLLPEPASPHVWQNADPQKAVRYRIRIKNILNKELKGVKLSDVVENLPGTPHFEAMAQQNPMMNNPEFAALVGPNAGQLYSVTWEPWRPVMAYHGQAEIWKAEVDLQPLQEITFTMRVQHRYTSCDSFLSGDNPVGNRFGAQWQGKAKRPGPKWKDLPVEEKLWTASGSATAQMAEPPKCDLRVKKSVLNNAQKIVFGEALTYEVTYTNYSDAPAEVWTLSDLIRIVDSNYALSLPYKYDYDCDGVGVSKAPDLGAGSGGAQHAGQPHQGAPIIKFGGGSPVVFDQKGALKCTVNVTFTRPAQGDPYCTHDDPRLENIALMDVGLYGPGAPFPPTGAYDGAKGAANFQPKPMGSANWASVRLPLPKCLNVQANKTAEPTVTWETLKNGNLKYTIVVKNYGADIAPNDGSHVVLKDLFKNPKPNIVPGSLAWSDPSCCIQNGSGLDPFVLRIQNLKSQEEATITFMVASPPPFEKPKYRNDVVVYRAGTDHTDWYANTDQSCTAADPPHTAVPPGAMAIGCGRAEVQVLGVGNLRVNKEVVNNTPFVLPSGKKYDVKIDCALPGIDKLPDVDGLQALDVANDFSYPDPQPPFKGVNKIEAGKGISFNGLPANAQCTISEPPLPEIPPSEAGECDGLGAQWRTSYVSSQAAPAPELSPGQIKIWVKESNQTKVTITNTLECKKAGGFEITKGLADPQGQYKIWTHHKGLEPGAKFHIAVKCGQGQSDSKGLDPDPKPVTFKTQSLPLGASCTIEEKMLYVPSSLAKTFGCTGDTPYMVWQPTYSHQSPLPATSPATQVTVTNKAVCTDVPPVCKLKVEKSGDPTAGFQIAVTNIGGADCDHVTIADVGGGGNNDYGSDLYLAMIPQFNAPGWTHDGSWQNPQSALFKADFYKKAPNATLKPGATATFALPAGKYFDPIAFLKQTDPPTPPTQNAGGVNCAFAMTDKTQFPGLLGAAVSAASSVFSSFTNATPKMPLNSSTGNVKFANDMNATFAQAPNDAVHCVGFDIPSGRWPSPPSMNAPRPALPFPGAAAPSLKGAAAAKASAQIYLPGEPAPSDNEAAVLNASEVLRVRTTDTDE